MSNFKTEQEDFWAGEFGDTYIDRNTEDIHLASNIALFSSIIKRTNNIKSILEFGANIGLNLKAIRQLLPSSTLEGVEINSKATQVLETVIGKERTYNQSILDFKVDNQRDFVFTKGVLIHINPQELEQVYTRLYEASKRYICVIEYYNPQPVEIPYRGHKGFLFKRDFAGELMDTFSDLELIDYGFAYHRANQFKMGDATWFLLKKKTT